MTIRFVYKNTTLAIEEKELKGRKSGSKEPTSEASEVAQARSVDSLAR